MHMCNFSLFVRRGSFHPRWVPFSPCSHATFYLSPLTADSQRARPITAELPGVSRQICREKGTAASSRGFLKNANPSQCEALMSLPPSEHAHRDDCVSMKGSTLLLSHSITLLIPPSSSSSSSSLKQTHISVFFIRTNTNVFSPCSDVNLWIGRISPADILHSMWRFLWWCGCKTYNLRSEWSDGTAGSFYLVVREHIEKSDPHKASLVRLVFYWRQNKKNVKLLVVQVVSFSECAALPKPSTCRLSSDSTCLIFC